MHSEVFLPWLYISSVICCVLLCNILHYVYHLFIKTTVQEKKDTIFDFLLMIISACFQVYSLINAYFLIMMFVNNFQDFNPWFVCTLLNVKTVSGYFLLECVFLIKLFFFLFYVIPDCTKNWNNNVVMNLITFFLILFPAYLLFIQIMTCGKESFCPPSFQAPGRLLPKTLPDNTTNIRNFQEAISVKSMEADNTCRGIVNRFLLPPSFLVMLFCTLAIVMKAILVKLSLLPSPSLPTSTLSYPAILITTSTILMFGATAEALFLLPQTLTLARLIFGTILPLVWILTNQRLFLFTMGLIRMGPATTN